MVDSIKKLLSFQGLASWPWGVVWQTWEATEQQPGDAGCFLTLKYPLDHICRVLGAERRGGDLPSPGREAGVDATRWRDKRATFLRQQKVQMVQMVHQQKVQMVHQPIFAGPFNS